MKGYFFLVGICFSLLACAQPKVVLYGYSQKFIPGAHPADEIAVEGGEQKIKPPRVITNYIIYMQADSALDIIPASIWVGNKWDTVVGKNLIHTPLMVEYPQKRTLVPATKQKVYEIVMGDTLKVLPSLSSKLSKQMKENELIVGYWLKGKKYYATLKKLVELEPLLGM